MRDKKACGHERRYRCACHPLSNRRRRQADLLDLMNQPIGVRLGHVGQDAAETVEDEEQDDSE
ncbi:MAG: hypothetical protein HYZ89_03900 [Candidatus Omnitrophica bacterium]|nr:hypothetical protein [Candidatus Omnitrophota bacterium]